MCRKHEARDARETLAGAIDRFEAAVETIVPAPPPLARETRALAALGEVFRGAAATVPLPHPGEKAGRLK